VQPEEVTKRPTLQEQLAKLREKKANIENETEDGTKSSTSPTKVKSSVEESAGITNVKSLPVMIHPSSNEELEQSMEIATDTVNEEEKNKRHDFVREARSYQSLSKLRNKLVTAKIKGVKKKTNDL